ncbi:chromatin remodeling complex / DNA-dep ATPase [Perkinsela sp. CCAP 1560/4]|nr:chromatin remodeling complex / DNA-dep ATPase [Perkinsela sp. CCAP 1560/4]|eukprot:KNH07449.1 chromatin remodeling complex / DNA-dep ATPase [Perkinsela sp. CCAP 1560/4]
MSEWTTHAVSAASVESKIHREFLESKRIEGEKQIARAIEQVQADLKNALVKQTLSDDLEERDEIQEKIQELQKELLAWQNGVYTPARPPSAIFVHEDKSVGSIDTNSYFLPVKTRPSLSANPNLSHEQVVRRGSSLSKRKRPVAHSTDVEAERTRMQTYVSRDRVDRKSGPPQPAPLDADSLIDESDIALENEFAEAYMEGKSRMPNSIDTPRASLHDLWSDHSQPKITFSNGLTLPASIWRLLFPHQQVAIQWLFELDTLGVGGILADEMGLGKTIEMAVFIGALHYSGLSRGMTLIACPATVLAQWVRELEHWIPCVPVCVLHSSMKVEETPAELLRTAMRTNAVVLTTYATMHMHRELILSLRRLHYVFLDEGHVIRNAAIQTAQVCHRLPTPHRIISTGTPIQNSLQELWGIFHFVHPDLLGTLNTFTGVFHEPIRRGSMLNASRHDIRAAYEYSRQLKGRISPFFLRRLKCEVDMHLKGKTEDIIYVKLTDAQVEKYRHIAESQKLNECIQKHKVVHQVRSPTVSLGEVGEIFRSITFLRKVCNHSWFVMEDPPRVTADSLPECMDGSSKLRVLLDLIFKWHAAHEKAVVYSQSRAVLDLIESCIACLNSREPSGRRLNYVRIDGGTAIAHRSALISALNNDDHVHLGLFTTRVGGVGINLTGCSKVVLFDPDWNPIIDIQARERVWRFGQKKDVSIYRLICAGTIEEKIYHRQLHKLFTMQSVLSKQPVDFAQMIKFSPEEVSGLFSLGAEYRTNTRNHRHGLGAQDIGRAPTGSADPMGLLKAVFDTTGVVHVDSFDQIAHKIGIDEHPLVGDGRIAQRVVERKVSLLGEVARPVCDKPRLPANE